VREFSLVLLLKCGCRSELLRDLRGLRVLGFFLCQLLILANVLRRNVLECVGELIYLFLPLKLFFALSFVNFLLIVVLLVLKRDVLDCSFFGVWFVFVGLLLEILGC